MLQSLWKKLAIIISTLQSLKLWLSCNNRKQAESILKVLCKQSLAGQLVRNSHQQLIMENTSRGVRTKSI